MCSTCAKKEKMQGKKLRRLQEFMAVFNFVVEIAVT